MTEAEWLACDCPRLMLEFLIHKAGDRKLRLFSVACGRRIWHLLDYRGHLSVDEADPDNCDGLEAPAFRSDLPSFYAWAEAVGSGMSDEICLGAKAAHHVARNEIPLVSQCAIAALGSGDNGQAERVAQVGNIRCIFGNPFRAASLEPAWHTLTTLTVAQLIYADRAFDRLPILADALEDAGCTNAEVLEHCRQPAEHVRGCWVVDLVLGKS